MKKILPILKEFFYVLSGALVIFGLLELVWPGIILAYINMNWVLIFWAFAGIIILVIDNN